MRQELFEYMQENHNITLVESEMQDIERIVSHSPPCYDVVSVCTAYEQGYGYGYEQRNLTNPYKSDSPEWIAWDYGYSEGNRKKLSS